MLFVQCDPFQMVLNMISTSLFVLDGRVFENLMVAVRATNAKLKDRAARIVSQLTSLPRTAAFALIDQAGGSVKIALAMHMLSEAEAGAEAGAEPCGRERAVAALSAADGKLHRLLN